MTLQPQTSKQAKCPHTRISGRGSNSVQERVTCVDCGLCLGMVHYGRAPDAWILQLLHHAREHRPHLWDMVNSMPRRSQAPPTAPPQTSAAPGQASSSGSAGENRQVPPPPQATTSKKNCVTAGPSSPPVVIHAHAPGSIPPPVVINIMNSGVPGQEEPEPQ